MIQTNPSPQLRGFDDEVVLPAIQELCESTRTGPKEKFFDKHCLRWVHWFGKDPAAFCKELKNVQPAGDNSLGPIERFFLENVPLKPAVKEAFEKKFEELPKDLPRRLILLRALISAHRGRTPLSWLEPQEREPGTDILDRASIAFPLSELADLRYITHDVAQDVLRSAYLKESFMEFITHRLPSLAGLEDRGQKTAFPDPGNRSLPQLLDWAELFVVSRRENAVFHDLFLRASRSQFTTQSIAPVKFGASFSLTKTAQDPLWAKAGRAPLVVQGFEELGDVLPESVGRSLDRLNLWMQATLASNLWSRHKVLKGYLDNEDVDLAMPLIMRMNEEDLLKAAALLKVLRLELGRKGKNGLRPADRERMGQIGEGLSRIVEAKRSKPRLAGQQPKLVSELSKIVMQLYFWLEEQTGGEDIKRRYSAEVSLNLWDLLKTMRCPTTEPFNCLHPIYLGPFRFNIVALACLPYQFATLLRAGEQTIGFSMSHGVLLNGEAPALIRDYAHPAVSDCIYSSLMERLDCRISDLLGIPILNPSGLKEASLQEFEFPSHPFTVCFDFLFEIKLGPNGGHRPHRKIWAHVTHPSQDVAAHPAGAAKPGGERG